MSVPYGHPPPAQQQPGPAGSPGDGPGLSKILAIVPGGLGLVLYLLSFTDGAGGYLRDLLGVLLLGGGLLATTSALPKGPRTLVPATVAVLTGSLFLLVAVAKGPPIDLPGAAGETPALAVVAVILAVLQSAACVGAVLLELGLVKAAAAGRADSFPPRSWAPQQPGGRPGGPQGAYPPSPGGYPGPGGFPGGPVPGGPVPGGPAPGGPAPGGPVPGGPAPGGPVPGGPAFGGYPGPGGYPGAAGPGGYPGAPASSGYPGGPGLGGYPGQPAAGPSQGSPASASQASDVSQTVEYRSGLGLGDGYDSQPGKYGDAGKYSSELGKYSSELGKYDSDVGKYGDVGKYDDVGKYSSELGKYSSELGKYDSELGKYDSELGKYDSELGKYDSDVKERYSSNGLGQHSAEPAEHSSKPELDAEQAEQPERSGDRPGTPPSGFGAPGKD